MTDEEALKDLLRYALLEDPANRGGKPSKEMADKFFAVLARMVPPGWKLVPVEPTLEMRAAFHVANERYENCLGDSAPDDQWTAMLAAAPKPPTARPGPDGAGETPAAPAGREGGRDAG